MGLMMLAAGKGSHVVRETDGADERYALHAIVALIGDSFGEGG
jgi:phosphocarrier protein